MAVTPDTAAVKASLTAAKEPMRDDVMQPVPDT